MVQRKTAGAAVLHRVTSWTSAFSGQRGQLICCSQPTKEDRCEAAAAVRSQARGRRVQQQPPRQLSRKGWRPCERVLPPPRGRDLNIGLRCASRHASVDDTCESTSGGVRRDYEVLDGVGGIRLLARAGNRDFFLYVVPQARHQPEANSALATLHAVVGVAEVNSS